MADRTEPQSITAGFSVSWNKVLTEYANALFSLTYLLRNAKTGQSLTIPTTPSGTFGYTASIAPTATGDLPPGTYRLTGYVTDDATAGATVKTIVFDGTMELLPDPVTAHGDQRTFARRTRDALRATMEQMASGTLNSASVNGKTFSRRQLSEIRAELARFEELVRAEEVGTGSRNVYVRFNRT